jgi:DNA replication licensing factor MCM6
LLKQSIIHVDQDDIDFDEEELQGERPEDRRNGVHTDEDTVMQSTAMDESLGDSMDVFSGSPRPQHHPATTSNLATSSSPPPAAPVQPARKMKITHDRYVTLQNLIMMHLAEYERKSGSGLDRDELIDWYLELKEGEIQNIAELEYEKELIGKVLNKLVKVCFYPDDPRHETSNLMSYPG